MSFLQKLKNTHIPNLINILAILNFFILTKQELNILKLDIFDIAQVSWNKSQNYIYYFDIQNNDIDDENVLQIFCEAKYVIESLKVIVINESILNNSNYNYSDIVPIEIIPRNYHSKNRPLIDRGYFEVLAKKREKNQKYFAILVEPFLFNNDTQIEIYISPKIENYNIYKSDIDNGKMFIKNFQMNNKKEKFFKFNLINISLKEENIIFYTSDKGVSSFYLETIASIEYKSKLFILEKNSSNKMNHTIYLSLLGEANNTKIQITLDDHDIKYLYGDTRNETSFYIERLNCNKDFYIFETYKDYKNDYHLHIIPFYGDYNMVYYDTFIGLNLTDIFKPNDEINITTIIKKITNSFNVFKLTCKTVTLMKFKYIKENAIVHLNEGKELTTYINSDSESNLIFTDYSDRKYNLYFGLFGKNEIYNYTKVDLGLGTFGYHFTLNNSLESKSEIITEIYYNNEYYNENQFECTPNENGAYLKIYLISDQFYKNIVEGITTITYESKEISFKVRKDIIFDYFIFRAYSHNSSNLITCEYELKIVEPQYIKNGKVLLAINEVNNQKKNEIYIKFSNPYDKFNSRINKEDYVYLLANFDTKEKTIFPIYIDIRYYYNNSVIIIENSKPKILLNQKEYEIFGDENSTEKNQVLLNLYKCNTKNYFLKTYYENINNIISEEKISDNKTILFHDNIFNNTKLILYSNYSNDTSIVNNSTSLKQAPYYENGDIYMNYFSINKSLYKSIQFTNDYTISYKDNKKKISINWNNYISNKDIINNLQVNYSIYILPIKSPIKSICQMSLIPPNISIINKNSYEKDLEKGEYKVAIIASVINEEFPIIGFYDFSIIEVPTRINIILIIIILISVLIIIIGIILCLYRRNKRKRDIMEEMRFSRKSRLVSMANKFFGNDEDEQEIILNNEENENNSNNKKSENNDDDDNNNKNNIENTNVN